MHTATLLTCSQIRHKKSICNQFEQTISSSAKGFILMQIYFQFNLHPLRLDLAVHYCLFQKKLAMVEILYLVILLLRYYYAFSHKPFYSSTIIFIQKIAILIEEYLSLIFWQFQCLLTLKNDKLLKIIYKKL